MTVPEFIPVPTALFFLLAGVWTGNMFGHLAQAYYRRKAMKYERMRYERFAKMCEEHPEIIRKQMHIIPLDPQSPPPQ